MNSYNQSVADQWVLTRDRLDSTLLGLNESLFTVGNGYIGVRGYLNGPQIFTNSESDRSTYLNGVYESLPIEYDESAYGFAKYCDRIIPVPTLDISLIVNGSLLQSSDCQIQDFQQTLDMRAGVYRETYSIRLQDNQTIEFELVRLASLECKNLTMTRCSIRSKDFKGRLALEANLISRSSSVSNSEDPREGGQIPADHWIQESATLENGVFNFGHSTLNSKISVQTTMMCSSSEFDIESEDTVHGRLTKCYEFDAKPGAELDVTVSIAYSNSNPRAKESHHAICLDAIEQGFESVAEGQREYLRAFWNNADIEIVGDDFAQLSTRFCLFHLLQSTGRDDAASIAAKGVTGAGYDGHFFWDSEIYVLPFWLFTLPEKSKNLLFYRVKTLGRARARALQMGMKSGALFAWRTIGGDESSSYFPAGTAQYHINADIAYAAKTYYLITKDSKSLFEGLAELVWETARVWMHIGHYDKSSDPVFKLCEVTGPDEYTAMVDNNYFTNSMAQNHLLWAYELVGILQSYNDAACVVLMEDLGITMAEAETWRDAGRAMYLPINQTSQIIEQCDGFFDKPEWKFDDTQPSQYPLLLNFHPLNLYRHQVLKQADSVLAMLLNGRSLSDTVKRNTFNYYEPRTTHDSTLSHCVHSIVAAELGDMDMASNYASQTFEIDLCNKHNNTHYGIHTAAMGGVWMIATMGFAGLRYSDGDISFKPALPKHWDRLSFKLRAASSRFAITISQQSVVYELTEGAGPIHFQHRGIDCQLDQQQNVIRFDHD